MATLGNSWQLIAALGSSLQLLAGLSNADTVPGIAQKQLHAALGNSEAALGSLPWPFNLWLSECFRSQKQDVAAPGSSWKFLIAPGCSWQLLTAPGTSLQLQAALGSSYSSWKLLVILGSSW